MASTMSPTRSRSEWPERHHRHVRLEIELQHREVGVRIAADDLRIGDAPVGELGADQIGGGDHVVIGDHVRVAYP